MRKTDLDMLTMLLSTDWFLPYWHVLGMGVPGGSKIFAQQGCREIVRQIAGAAKEYWLTDFSEERVDRTNSLLQKLLQKVCSSEFTVSTIISLIGQTEKHAVDEGTSWLLVSLTEQVLCNTLAQAEQLNPAT